MVNSGIILESYRDVTKTYQQITWAKIVVDDNTESDGEENDNTDHDAGSKSEDTNIDGTEAMGSENDNPNDYGLRCYGDEIVFADDDAGNRHELWMQRLHYNTA